MKNLDIWEKDPAENYLKRRIHYAKIEGIAIGVIIGIILSFISLITTIAIFGC